MRGLCAVPALDLMRVLCLRGWCWCAGTGAVLVVAVAGHRPPGDPETEQPERRRGGMHEGRAPARGDVIYRPLRCFPSLELTFKNRSAFFWGMMVVWLGLPKNRGLVYGVFCVVEQLVACLVHTQEVDGSSPSCATGCLARCSGRGGNATCASLKDVYPEVR